MQSEFVPNRMGIFNCNFQETTTIGIRVIDDNNFYLDVIKMFKEVDIGIEVTDLQLNGF